MRPALSIFQGIHRMGDAPARQAVDPDAQDLIDFGKFYLPVSSF
jgi:hypothetical protein